MPMTDSCQHRIRNLVLIQVFFPKKAPSLAMKGGFLPLIILQGVAQIHCDG